MSKIKHSIGHAPISPTTSLEGINEQEAELVVPAVQQQLLESSTSCVPQEVGSKQELCTTYDLDTNPEFIKIAPDLPSKEYSLLEKLILSKGCTAAVATWGNTIIDGRHRYEICKKHSLPYYKKSMEFANEIEVKDWIILIQVGKRHLNNFQRGELIAGLSDNTLTLKARENQRLGGRTKVSQKSDKPIDVNKERARMAGICHDTYSRIKKIKQDGDIAIIEKLRNGSKSVNECYRRIRSKEKRKEIDEKKKKLDEEALEKPEGSFDVANVDPPWPHKGTPYSTEALEWIRQIILPMREDSVLYLWTTQKYIWDAKKILDDWGFTYSHIITWNKKILGRGGKVRQQCEFCLVGIKGNPLFANQSERDFVETKEDELDNVITEKRREHSRKPEAIYERIERLHGGRKLDYFSRQERVGWVSYGNEVDKFKEAA